MEIRPLHAADVPALVDDLWFPFAEEMGDIDPHDSLADDVDVRSEAIQYRRNQLGDEDVQTFVAVDDESERQSLAGYTTVSYSEAPSVFARGSVAKVKDLYVAPEARGDGLGTALLERAHEWGRERGCEQATLSVHARNDVAQSCYEELGYETRYVKMDRPL
ncbi:GNAT family N-acetyltransferase [Haloferax mediterranei ATCC 33500]|uniref:GCN5-related N-acetyltransferase n=1 Tax=Haloferax mediterranei (strain ATCC 33500 / DSM 1411 / JCM 8866 / NBRC 14739 / NCIMB 2177 / R-4) TaxID=523841 RepID=I3R712_HALMT|nr:GNAT family N-acetyltransferase [Haloferax mediterranei]AFK20022.1 GCN5-related N-acetyltransferase [Haloferax mediterranei ATCC 33500]AHZ23399.1 sporulation protein [Haloferax mediterranei ATCC 33500]ELZ99569.1 N-acetyltransferase GCN5 [Haloferax mediterranei ATCC 33500]MDX5987226.1 GNAT family N-acetyltransferase [Haloferax mediterranei ATCC 33500]QCQ76531.1 GNAT family N-acetyltransferase [Haloferax mediterranei ATCC 33500]